MFQICCALLKIVHPSQEDDVYSSDNTDDMDDNDGVDDSVEDGGNLVSMYTCTYITHIRMVIDGVLFLAEVYPYDKS